MTANRTSALDKILSSLVWREGSRGSNDEQWMHGVTTDVVLAAAVDELEALRAERDDLALFVRSTQENYEHAAPLHVTNEPQLGHGWAIYYHDDRYLFIPEGPDGLPILTPEIRAELRKDRLR